MAHAASGVNMIDVYQRSGLYKVPLPFVGGNEGAGIVEAVGAGVTLVRPGDRVAYSSVPGSYCEARNLAADRLCVLPDGISLEQGAAMMLKGMTVQYLLRRTYRVREGDTVLFHAAAGGVGLIACQWRKALGATVIGTAGSDEKCALARAHGADHCLNYRTDRRTVAWKPAGRPDRAFSSRSVRVAVPVGRRPGYDSGAQASCDTPRPGGQDDGP